MNKKTLTIIGTLLLCVIAVQTYFLMRLSDRVDKVTRNKGDAPSLISPPSSPPSPPSTAPAFPGIDKNWNPFEEMQRMQNEMNKIFGDMRSQLHQSPDFDNLNKPFSFSPNVDVKEEKNRIIVTADIPGSDESNINVKVEGNQLTITANTKKSSEQDKGNMYRSERFIGRFQRTITLPAPVRAEKMKTEYKDGILTIILPKA